jgi:hypothetical protein
MARSINDIYNFMRFIVNKQRGVFLTIPQAMDALDTGQLDAVETWFASYGETQQIHDAIRKLRVYQPYTSDSGGIVTFPDDYIHLLGTPFTVTGSTVNTVKFVEEDEISFLMTSQLRPIDNSYPVAVNNSNGFSIYPQQVQSGAYWMLKRPATPVLATSTSGRTITYLPNSSTQLEFSDMYINNIIARSLVYVSVFMSEQQVTAFAVSYNQETKQP